VTHNTQTRTQHTQVRAAREGFAKPSQKRNPLRNLGEHLEQKYYEVLKTYRKHGTLRRNEFMLCYYEALRNKDIIEEKVQRGLKEMVEGMLLEA